MTLGDRIKKIRCDRGLTQQQLADKLGVQRAAVHKYEKNLVSISTEQLSKISKSLNVISPIFEPNIVSDEEFVTTDIDEICYHLNEFNKAYFGEPFATLEITDYQIEFEIQEALKTLNIEGKKAVKKYIDDISPKYSLHENQVQNNHNT